MVVLCPVCDQYLEGDEDTTVVGPVPKHQFQGAHCSGTGRTGFGYHHHPALGPQPHPLGKKPKKRRDDDNGALLVN